VLDPVKTLFFDRCNDTPVFDQTSSRVVERRVLQKILPVLIGEIDPSTETED
jgi:hypothetical protein